MKWYRSLAFPASRQETGFCLVEGARAINQIIAAAPDTIDEILFDGPDLPVSPGACSVRKITHAQLASISNTKNPQNCIAIARIPADTFSSTMPHTDARRILVLEDVQDPGNVGTLIRTAAAFGFDGVMLSDKCADPFGPKAVQASAGSLFSLWIRRTHAYPALVDSLKSKGYHIVGTHLNGQGNTDWCRQKRIALLLGNEGAGLSSDLAKKADTLFRIPIHTNNIESLNVAASGAVCMYLSARKQ